MHIKEDNPGLKFQGRQLNLLSAGQGRGIPL